MSVRGLVGNRAGEMIQLAFTVAAVAAVVAAFRYRKGGDAKQLQALFLACTASASPYLGSYDLLPLTFASVALLAEEKLDATGRRLAQLIFWARRCNSGSATCKFRAPGLSRLPSPPICC